MKSFDIHGNVDRSSSNLDTWDKKGIFFSRKQVFLIIVGMIGIVSVVGVLSGTLGRKCSVNKTEDEKEKPEPEVVIKPPKRNVRLPGDIVPINYQIRLHPFFEPNFTFDGEVRIEMQCIKPTSTIILHSVKLNISTIDLRSNIGDEKVVTWDEDTSLNFLKIKVANPLSTDNVYILTIAFEGELTDGLTGLYRSSYKDENGQKRWLAATQFEPTDARRAFPCFDEPAMKATFDVILIRKHNMVSLSNMEIKNHVTRSDDYTEDHYYTSVRMSTYLLAFIVCDFGRDEKTTKSGVTFRVWARPEVMEQTKYALEIGVKILEHYEDFFGIPFPLNKTDMIAVPDFSAGAMENWGLITYRETAMLFDPIQSSASNKQRVAVVIAHELAHQWFGNLVSPAWWDDLWLNEGFASYVEYLGVAATEPTWKMHEQFIVEDLHVVLSADSVKSSHPISLPVYEPDEINEIFDKISYGKGSSIIRMMSYFLGFNMFKKGLTAYLNKFKFSNAATDDLWNTLTEVAHQEKMDVDVKVVMDTWTLQMGYPLISVIRDSEKHQTSITQTRFLLDPNVKSLKPKNYTDLGYVWEVAVTYVTQNDLNWDNSTQIWLHRNNVTLNHLLAPDDQWIIANVYQTGLFRVNYDHNNWELLIQQLLTDHTKISEINRAQIINDAFNLARAGILDYTIALNITQYLHKERDYLPWQSAFGVFDYVDNMLGRTGWYGLLSSYFLKKVTPLYEYLGWDDRLNDSHLTSVLRTATITRACSLGLETCILKAQNMYKNLMENSSYSIPGNQRSCVYCTAIRYGIQKEWEFAWDRYVNESNPTEGTKLLASMACTRDSWLLNRFLEAPFLTTSIRKQDTGLIIKYVSQNPSGRYLVWSYFVTHWKKIKEKLSGTTFLIVSYIRSATANFNTAFEIKQMENFLQLHKDELKAGEQTFYEQLERANANKRWMDKHLNTIVTWLEKN